MRDDEPSSEPPGPAALSAVFHVYSVERDGQTVKYVGEPLVAPGAVTEEIAPAFAQRGYEVSLQKRHSRDQQGAPAPYAVVAEPRSTGIDGIPWGNVVMFALTVATTLYAGTWWYQIDLAGNPLNLLEAWPFTAAVLGVLATHELGHYVASRYYDVDASLPYFIPVPPPIGTMGAIIRMRGRIPSRKALFDIGIAGPLAGLAATIVVTLIGLHLDPIAVSETASDGGAYIRFNDPLLLELLADLSNQPTAYGDGKAVNPVVFGGWVGMFVTFLNLIPVGQLDGGHILRAALGRRQATVAAAVPGVLFSLSAGLYFLTDYTQSMILWAIWGVIAFVMVRAGSATPLREDSIGPWRWGVAAVTFALGALCFMPVPIEIVMA